MVVSVRPLGVKEIDIIADGIELGDRIPCYQSENYLVLLLFYLWSGKSFDSWKHKRKSENHSHKAGRQMMQARPLLRWWNALIAANGIKQPIALSIVANKHTANLVF